VRGLCKGAKFSVSRESFKSAAATMTVTTEARKNAPKLSDSLFNTPLKFNNAVTPAE
jgi:hypothetical protein